MLPGIKQFDLKGRNAIITGGSKGLGEAMAAGLASAGANVMLVSRNEAEAVAAAERIAREFQVSARGYRADVMDEGEVHQMVDFCIDELGGVDILITSAGINIRGPISKLSYADFKKVQEINVNGVWLCCKAVLPHMKRKKHGRIINLSSALGVVGLADRTPYTASKGAVANMTRALALEVADDCVTVNAICPGPFLTAMNVPIAETVEGKTFIVGATAMKRWGEMREIQGAAIYLASDAGSYTTGSLLMVDGGWTSR